MPIHTRIKHHLSLYGRRFRRYIIIVNAGSTHAELGRKRATELERQYGSKRVTVIDMGQQTAQDILSEYADLLGPRTLLCIAAGDGTVSSVINGLVLDKTLPPKARHTTVLPLWGGNANDLAHMLNGTASNTPLHTILSKGHTIAVYPIHCQLSYADGHTTERVAACYASFGATAFAADRLNQSTHRGRLINRLPGGRFFSELHTGIRALIDAPVFKVSEAGKHSEVYERTFANGSRFAKVDNLPVKLNERRFYQHTITRKHLGDILARITGLGRTPDSDNGSHADFTVQEEILAQFDGEPWRIAAGTRVSVSLSKKPFYAFSTLLGKQDAGRSTNT